MRSKQFSFSTVPTIRARRSQFDLSQDIKTSGNVGKLMPFYVQEVYPGDTFKVKCTTVCRVTSAFLKPVMDNLFLDQYFFFVPSRLVYDRWAEVFGENKLSAWAQTSPVEVPGLATSKGTSRLNLIKNLPHNHVGGYLGLPVGTAINDTIIPEISVLPFRAFAMIYDQWFRDENNIDPMNIIMGATGTNEFLNSDNWAPDNYFGLLPNVARYHDLFSSSLPSPQKGDPVEIATAVLPASASPVVGISALDGSSVSTAELARINCKLGTIAALPSFVESLYPNYASSGSPGVGRVNITDSADDINAFSGPLSVDADGALQSDGSVVPVQSPVYLNGLFSFNREQPLGSVTVNDLRLAFQTQKMLEADARHGTRLTEFIEGHFGVHSPDARLQRAEFLGGKHTPINIYQVAQTSSTGSNYDQALGSLGAFAHTVGRSRFTKGFVEHGYVIGVMALRYHHTYSQGIEKFWTRRHRLDFYDPVFANIGEQPVYKRELFAGAAFDDVFGYNEAWVDLRTRPSRVSGQMSPNLAQSLDVYHFADEYANAPVLGQAFIEENSGFVDRTLAVGEDNSDQFIFDIYVKNSAIRELPVYSIPSLIDHH